MAHINVVIIILLENILFCSTYPVEPTKEIEKRQLSIQRTPDGGYQTTFSLANAFDVMGSKVTIAATQVHNTGPHGYSSSGGHAANIRGGSGRVAFDHSQSSSQAESQNQFGNAAANANAFANRIQTPWTSSFNGDSNAFAHVNRYNNPFNSPLSNNIGYF